MKKVVIDAGHGGSDGGAVGNGIVEKEMNLEISKYMSDRLDELGVENVLIRDSDYNNWKCGFFDSITELSGFQFKTTASIHVQCIPYNDETRHLVGTKEDCPEYYKTW